MRAFFSVLAALSFWASASEICLAEDDGAIQALLRGARDASEAHRVLDEHFGRFLTYADRPTTSRKLNRFVVRVGRAGLESLPDRALFATLVRATPDIHQGFRRDWESQQTQLTAHDRRWLGILLAAELTRLGLTHHYYEDRPLRHDGVRYVSTAFALPIATALYFATGTLEVIKDNLYLDPMISPVHQLNFFVAALAVGYALGRSVEWAYARIALRSTRSSLEELLGFIERNDLEGSVDNAASYAEHHQARLQQYLRYALGPDESPLCKTKLAAGHSSLHMPVK